MIKKLLLPTLITLSAGYLPTAYASDYYHTVTGGYAQTSVNADTDGITPRGVNFKYHFQEADNPLGFISSFTYTYGEKDNNDNGYKSNYEVDYLSLLVGPSYTFADTVRLYGLIGISRAGARETHSSSYWNYDYETQRTDFTYGLGTQFIINKSFVLDASWEHARYSDSIGKVQTNTITFGGGWQF